jgi:hypothetical protein
MSFYYAQNLVEKSVVLQAHDEIVAEVDISVPAKTIRDLMTRTPDWMPGLPMASKAGDVDRYSK